MSARLPRQDRHGGVKDHVTVSAHRFPKNGFGPEKFFAKNASTVNYLFTFFTNSFKTMLSYGTMYRRCLMFNLDTPWQQVPSVWYPTNITWPS